MSQRQRINQVRDLIAEGAEANRKFGWPGMPIEHFPLHLTDTVELMIETQELVLHFAKADGRNHQFVTWPVYGHAIQTWSDTRLMSAFECNTVGQREILTELHRRALAVEQAVTDVASGMTVDQLASAAVNSGSSAGRAACRRRLAELTA